VFCIQRAGVKDAPQVAELIGALLDEISVAAGAPQFDVGIESLTTQARDFLASGHYTVLLASESEASPPVGVLALYRAGTLYANGYFGVIAELYVCPPWRSRGIGRRLLDAAQRLAVIQGWTRLEVTTPPLPEYERTQRFYERHGFAVTGGRKLRWLHQRASA